ncbi:MAG TPA: haloacid dehalogenase-like hydrolase [Acholeplasma sp.]|jgi:hypothetical protein|nr:haloacid dehalogenase-like hydrolase [Acholeplasma sp.]
MTKRILDIRPNEFKDLTKDDIIQSINASEGRTMVSEVICAAMPMLYDVSNAELAASLGADIILLNVYDVNKPYLMGFEPLPNKTVVESLKEKVGRVIGINLEPVDNKEMLEKKDTIDTGRTATAENARLAYEQGVQLLVLTGNPKTGVSNDAIISSLKAIRKELGEKLVLVAGKMHSSGTAGEASSRIIDKKTINDFIEAGADIILIPAPGTVPGITLEFVKAMTDFVHSKGKMVLTTIGTSQEGASVETIRQIALMCKMAGADMHHIGDTGFFGMAVPENIFEYSKTIRGVRHTYRRMAMK